MSRFSALLATSLAAVVLPVAAHSYKVGDLHIGHPWARPTVAGQTAGGAFLKIENRGRAADKLLSARSDVAASTELHSMTMDGHVMRMREMDELPLPAGQTVELKPGGLHIMFTGLKAPLKTGDRVPLILKFERAGEVTVEVKVETPAAPAATPAPTPAGHEHH
ncbi:copper chaperone PCu(A)C [Schlegelella sp. S2-27]|uniref:Copper chaperone PCu(A)C n=1 Tax=Caldimonas mangrovi TaxID=2944811 RepID=A0ABT0YMF3_9BURK|nr:copper chaperone PCu(A)C [Caldimonas mangrovi]MCM5679916.1 copper chaperone PCu(A)C [Caldimonas mangrovi]